MQGSAPIRRLVFVICLLLLASKIWADEARGTPAEAQALVARAIAFYDESGQEAAFALIEDKSGEFVDRDLYVFVYGPERTIVAHGFDPALNATAIDSLIDIYGVPFGARIMDGATGDGVWIDYAWYDPATREILPKSSWVVRHDDYVFGVGVYSTGR